MGRVRLTRQLAQAQATVLPRLIEQFAGKAIGDLIHRKYHGIQLNTMMENFTTVNRVICQK